jgi:zinc transport system substrate-binding protein
MRRLILSILILALSAACIFAEGQKDTGSENGVIATTSWTASFAEIAGLEDIRILAPYELQHPPEYELTPGDIRAIGEAKMIVFAGYEVMMERLKDATATNAQMVQIETVNTWPVIRESVGKIAAAAGTTAKAEAGLAKVETFFKEWREELAPYRGMPVISHMFLQGLAKSLGFEVVGTFGPAPLEAKQLKELSSGEAKLIIDNWHTDVGAPLREVMPDAARVEFINFPGKDGTRTLLDVLEYNRGELDRALR